MNHSMDPTTRTTGSIGRGRACQHPTGFRKTGGGCNRVAEQRIEARDGGWWLPPDKRLLVQRQRPRALAPWRHPEERNVCRICASMIRTGRPPATPVPKLTERQRQDCLNGDSQAHAAVSKPRKVPTPRADSRRTQVVWLLHQGVAVDDIAASWECKRSVVRREIRRARHFGLLEGDLPTDQGRALLRRVGLLHEEVA